MYCTHFNDQLAVYMFPTVHACTNAYMCECIYYSGGSMVLSSGGICMVGNVSTLKKDTSDKLRKGERFCPFKSVQSDIEEAHS